MSELRYRGLWQWNPVSCVTPRSYDEKHMAARDEWFFDRAFMSRYFDAMAAAGLNTWILANTHPFPFMVDLSAFPDAVVLARAELERRQAHYHWLFETARARGVLPFVLFHTCYVPDAFGRKHGIRPVHSYAPSPLACDYTRHCVRRLCETYPELAGINGEASENVAAAQRAQFARDAIVAGVRESGQRPALFFRGWTSDPVEMKRNVMDAYDGECFFTVKYTWEFLVHRRPDPEFLRWTRTCGAERVLAEFWISNYQPFGCHDLDLAGGIRQELESLGCAGFTSHPMDLYGAPFVQGPQAGLLQLDRDRDWYATLSGACPVGSAGVPPASSPERGRFLGVEDTRSLDVCGRAACVPNQRISFYLTGNKQNFLQPQWLAAIAGSPERRAGLHTLFHWKNLPTSVDKSYGRWMPQLDATAVRYPGEEGEGFGLEDLIRDLDLLDSEWIDPPASAPERPDAYAAWRRDVLGLRQMARAWTDRARAVSAHFSGRAAEVPPALRRSLDLVRGMPEIMGFDGPYRLLVGRHVVILRWTDLAGALERELADYAAGRVQDYYFFGQAEHYDKWGADFVEKGKQGA